MSFPTRPSTEAGDRVPWSQLIAYGMGGLIPIALFNIAGQLMGLLGNISLGLSALWLGTIMIIPRLWDAISDPIVGYLSDNTRSRWGRRRPYIFIGGIAVAVTFVAMWWVPRGEWIHEYFPSETSYNTFQLGYVLVGLLLFFTATTIFEIPHGALGLEMSGDYHERTRLFSAKSFLGNLFAMGTPALFLLAERFRGPGGDLTDGMRYVSMIIAVGLIPMSFWWFLVLREPGFAIAKQQQKTTFWEAMGATLGNTTFLRLIAIIFTLAMGFNFVSLFNYYITIFYLYGGDESAAGYLLWINGVVWAVTALVAVFPLNWISRRIGKNKTLLLAIALMCAAQLSKTFAYNPQLPYLVLIPTVLLSGGMLMFFTLGSSMVGDACDLDELVTGTRNEGSFFSVYWWFIKLGSAFASFVTGALLVFTTFDEKQNVVVNALRGNAEVLKAEAEKWAANDFAYEDRVATMHEQLDLTAGKINELRRHLSEQPTDDSAQAEHVAELTNHTDELGARIASLRDRSGRLVDTPTAVMQEMEAVIDDTKFLKKQMPQTLFRLRMVEIGLPLAMSCVSILLTLGYPLTEARAYEIKQALEKRHAETIG